MTSEELATILREELPGWRVTAEPKVFLAYATATRGDWKFKLIGPDGQRGTLAILDPPEPDCACDDPCNQFTARAPDGDESHDAIRAAVRTAIASARAWVAALQEGCP
jgi:hypothetical protein